MPVVGPQVSARVDDGRRAEAGLESGIEDVASLHDNIMARAQTFLYRCKLDRDYTMVHLAGAVTDVTGYGIADLLENTTIAFAAIIHPEDAARLEEIVAHAVRERRTWDVDYRIVRKDGRDRWVREQGGPVYEGGAAAYLEGSIMDIHERKVADLARADVSDQVIEVSRDIGRIAGRLTQVLNILRILSLNARIEAAREGNAGFGAVASEVSEVAKETAPLAAKVRERLVELTQLLT